MITSSSRATATFAFWVTRPGSYIQYSYNARDWLTAVLNRTTGGATVYDARYYYQDGTLWDHTGNPVKRTEDFGSGLYPTTLRYDKVYRETEETRRNPGGTVDYSITYGYDAVGNRTTRVKDGVTVTYTYDDNDKMTAASGGGQSASFGYDGAGSMTSAAGSMYGAWALVYDDESRPTSITYPSGGGSVTDLLTYNAVGQRMRARLNGTWGRYFYNGERVLEETNDANGTLARYTTESGSYYEPLLHFGRNDGSVRYPLYDGIGTARRLADAAGALTDSYTLDTFGRQISVTGTTPNPYRFGGAWGYITDPSGMQQLGARYYWPEVGRFVQRDRIRNAQLSYQYAYVADNPLRLIDADGRTPYWLSPDPGEREAYAQEALKACKDHARENFTDCLCHSGLPLVAGGGLSIGGVLVGKAKQAAAGLIGGPVAGGVIAAGGAISLGLGAYNAAACFQAQAMEKESCDAAYRWVVNYNATASGQ